MRAFARGLESTVCLVLLPAEIPGDVRCTKRWSWRNFRSWTWTGSEVLLMTLKAEEWKWFP